MVRQMRTTAAPIAELAAEGVELLVTHGNGPQVGALLRSTELAAGEVAPRPLFALDAESEGQIGLVIAQELGNALRRAKVPRDVVAWISRVEVSSRDPEFRNPSKPIGAFYDETTARRLRKQNGWTMIHDAARGGWRRVVPSPRPVRWVEGELVRALFDAGLASQWIPIAAGGGGVPVVRRPNGELEGIDAVIDKDRTAAILARTIGARTLVIVTDVPGIALGFGTRWERWVGKIDADELARHERAGEFPRGSMGPKVAAGLEFLGGGGEEFVVTDIPSLARAVRGEAGTHVRRAA